MSSTSTELRFSSFESIQDCCLRQISNLYATYEINKLAIIIIGSVHVTFIRHTCWASKVTPHTSILNVVTVVLPNAVGRTVQQPQLRASTLNIIKQDGPSALPKESSLKRSSTCNVSSSTNINNIQGVEGRRGGRGGVVVGGTYKVAISKESIGLLQT